MFKLLIECTKNIDKLEIDFSDGTSVIQSSPKTPNSPQRKSVQDRLNSLDLDGEFGELSKEIVQKPNIPETKRDVKVAQELQNFNL